MNMALDSGRFSDGQIPLINYCRLYLQVVTLSDIASADGQTIDPAILCGTVSLLSSSTTWLHVNQSRPDTSTWRVWKSFMRVPRCILTTTPLATGCTLLRNYAVPGQRTSTILPRMCSSEVRRVFSYATDALHRAIPLDGGEYHHLPPQRCLRWQHYMTMMSSNCTLLAVIW
jgi:hypothetical protein